MACVYSADNFKPQKISYEGRTMERKLDFSTLCFFYLSLERKVKDNISAKVKDNLIKKQKFFSKKESR